MEIINQKKRILYVLPDMSNAGPVNMCLNLIGRLNKEKYEVHIASLGKGELVHEFQKHGNVFIFQRKNILKFKSFVENGGYDIIHSHTIISDIFSYLCRTNAIKVTTIHNYPDVDSIYRRGKIIGGALFLLQKYSIDKMNKVACSSSVGKYCESVLHMKNVLSVPNGVNRNTYSRKEAVDVNMVQYYYLGSLNERKNVDFLLRGFSEWVEGKNAQLNVLGDGDLLSSLSDKYKNDNIFFYGKVSKPYEVVCNYDCFISCSKAEGMPLALLESLSMGSAYICSNIDPHLEVYVSDNGRSGFVYESENIRDFISKLDAYYYAADKNEMSECALETFRTLYDSRIMAGKYDGVYQYLLSL